MAGKPTREMRQIKLLDDLVVSVIRKAEDRSMWHVTNKRDMSKTDRDCTAAN